MTDKKYLVPDVIDPAEKVCVRLEIPNDIKHIAAFWGALQELGEAWNWEDGYDSGFATSRVWRDVIENASEAVRIGEGCMLDCGDVEDCLETSTIITIIEADILVSEADIIVNETNITNTTNNVTNILEGGDDTNVYPVLPTFSEPDPLCGAAHKVASEVIALTEQTVIDVGTLTLASWLLALLGIGGWLATQLSLFWTYILANEIALIGVDFDLHQDLVADAWYCAELDRDMAISGLSGTIPALERDALIKAMESVTDAQIALWAFIGSLDTTQDCSDFSCVGWVNTFDFTIEQYEWIAINSGYPLPAGDYIAGLYWQSKVQNKGGGDVSALQLSLTFPFDVNITRVLVEHTVLVGGAANISRVRTLDGGGSTTWIGALPTGEGSYSTDFDPIDETGIAEVRLGLHDTEEDRTFRVTKVIIEGTGPDPSYGA